MSDQITPGEAEQRLNDLIEKAKDEIRPCTCKDDIGSTTIWCCNYCGHPKEKIWTK